MPGPEGPAHGLAGRGDGYPLNTDHGVFSYTVIQIVAAATGSDRRGLSSISKAQESIVHYAPHTGYIGLLSA